MNAGGVPNTCKSSGKVLHSVFDRRSVKLPKRMKKTLAREIDRSGDGIMSVEYTSGGRLSNT